MARLLTGNARQRERALQEAMQTRLSVSFRNGMRGEIGRTMRQMADAYAASGNVPVADDHQARVRALLIRDYTAVIEWSAGRIMDAAGKGRRSPIGRKASGKALYERLLEQYISEWGGQKITEITETTRNQVMRLVQKGVDDGLGQREIAAMIGRNTAELAGLRSNLIARTESHGASNFAAQQAAVETSIPLKKEWVTVEDSRTRDSHAETDGQTVLLDEPFSVLGEPLMFPGDPVGSGANVINCRCASVHVVDD